jgi:hypothetical protein
MGGTTWETETKQAEEKDGSEEEPQSKRLEIVNDC